MVVKTPTVIVFKILQFLLNKVKPSSEVIIDPIETKAMKNAKDSGQTTFALFKPAKGIPVLVKVIPAPNNKQVSFNVN